MTTTPYHIPALLNPSLDALNIDAAGIYVDCTFGGGGHTRGILERMSADAAERGVEVTGRVIAFDQDIDAIRRAEAPGGLAREYSQLELVHGNFRFLSNYLRYNGVEQINGLLADLGVSFHHFDEADRGFSFRMEGPLDMRMNRNAPQSAADLLARADAEQIADWLYLYGELRQARQMARLIVKEREHKPIDTTTRLLEVVAPTINPKQEKKELAQVFQALRIVVNGEIDALQNLLTQATQKLADNGRIAIITYHSLEDRLVKNFLKTGNLEGHEQKDFFGRNLSPFRLLTSKPIVPDSAEIEANPRSRSAKLRVAQKLPEHS